MPRWYGSVSNRIEEGKNYTGREIRVGDDITLYYYSDRTCYYVTKVVSQTNIFVRRYLVMADKEKKGGMGHQNWKYFKTEKEKQEYINECIKKGLMSDYCYNAANTDDDFDIEWVYRYNKWRMVTRITPDEWKRMIERAREELKDPSDDIVAAAVARFYAGLNDKDMEKIEAGKTVNKYYDLGGGVSFGVRDYYYDWEF